MHCKQGDATGFEAGSGCAAVQLGFPMIDQAVTGSTAVARHGDMPGWMTLSMPVI